MISMRFARMRRNGAPFVVHDFVKGHRAGVRDAVICFEGV